MGDHTWLYVPFTSLANAEILEEVLFTLTVPSNDQENRWEKVELLNRWNFLTGSLWPFSTRHSPVLHFHTWRKRQCSSSQKLMTFKVSWNWFAKHIALKYWFWFKVINFLSTAVYYTFLQNLNVHASAHNYQLLNSSPTHTHTSSAWHQRHNESMSPVMTQCLKLLKLKQQLQQKFVSRWRNY